MQLTKATVPRHSVGAPTSVLFVIPSPLPLIPCSADSDSSPATAVAASPSSSVSLRHVRTPLLAVLLIAGHCLVGVSTTRHFDITNHGGYP